jgi:hypothetical protein
MALTSIHQLNGNQCECTFLCEQAGGGTKALEQLLTWDFVNYLWPRNVLTFDMNQDQGVQQNAQ